MPSVITHKSGIPTAWELSAKSVARMTTNSPSVSADIEVTAAMPKATFRVTN